MLGSLLEGFEDGVRVEICLFVIADVADVVKLKCQEPVTIVGSRHQDSDSFVGRVLSQLVTRDGALSACELKSFGNGDLCVAANVDCGRSGLPVN